jgi:hypothetical protein
MDMKPASNSSISLKERETRKDIGTNIMFLDIIHRPVYFSKHDVLGTGLCLCLQVLVGPN